MRGDGSLRWTSNPNAADEWAGRIFGGAVQFSREVTPFLGQETVGRGEVKMPEGWMWGKR
jgi:hypothetical protein